MININVGTVAQPVNIHGTLATSGAGGGTISIKGTPDISASAGTLSIENLDQSRGTYNQITTISSAQSGSVGQLLTGANTATIPGSRVTSLLGTWTVALSPNPNREYACLSNYSFTQVNVIFGEPIAGSLKGITIGGLERFEINRNKLWRGTVSIRSYDVTGGSEIIGLVDFP